MKTKNFKCMRIFCLVLSILITMASTSVQAAEPKYKYLGSYSEGSPIQKNRIEFQDRQLTYTGAEITPSFTVFYNYKMVNTADYTYAFDNNIEIGTGSVVVTLENGEKITGDFYIVPEAPILKEVQINKKNAVVSWTHGDEQIDGYIISYGDNVCMHDKKEIKVADPDKIRRIIKKLHSGCRLIVYVQTYKTVNGKDYRSSVSNVIYTNIP